MFVYVSSEALLTAIVITIFFYDNLLWLAFFVLT